MSNRPQRGSIRPKLTNIPRRPSAAATHLEAYKLAVEKARLQEELAAISARQEQIDCRIAQIDRQSAQLLDASSGESSPANAPEPRRANGNASGGFKTFAVEY